MSATAAWATDGAWQGTVNALWTNSANWNASFYPGSGAGETATFDTAGNGNTVLDLLGLDSLRNITFSGVGAAAYTLGTGGANGQSLTLESSGTLTLSNTVVNSQTVNATVLLGTNTSTATYTFQNDQTDHTLTFEGDVAGAASGGTPGVKTLNLSGYGRTMIKGALSNGGASRLDLNSYGTNTLAGNNTFTGNIVVLDGTLRLTRSGALGTGTKTVTAATNVGGRNPSVVLDGSAGDLTIPANVTFNTSQSRAGAVINEAGDNTILGNFTLTSGDGATHIWSKGGTLTLAGTLRPTTDSRQLYLRGDSHGFISGVITNGSTSALPVYKDVGTGTWTLSGANTYSGATTISAGGLAIAGASGTINASSAITVNNGATLLLSNTASANHSNRLMDSATLTMANATLVFANDASEASFSETVGTLALSSGLITVSTAQAAEGQTSTLTLSGLTRAGSATVNFTGEGLGTSRNRIIITGKADGPLGVWATVSGTSPALYSSTLGVYADAQTEIAAKGDTLVHNSGNVVIASEGTTGPNELSDSVTAIASLAQNTASVSTVNTADKTLQVGTVVIAAEKADLTLGLAPNDGTLATPAAGATLALGNYSASTLTVNAAIADNATPSSLTKFGTGAVVLAGTNSFSGAVSVQQGSLTLANSLALQNATLGTAGAVFDSSVAGNAFTLGNLTNTFALPLTDSAANPVALSVGNNGADSSFGGAFSSSGSLHKVGSGTLRLTGTSTHSGGTTVSGGTLTTGVAGGLGNGPVANNATLTLTGGGLTYTGLSTALSGTGTVNVILSTTVGNTTTLSGDYSDFTGLWNLGVNAPVTGSGKALMNGPDNAAATLNILSNATLVSNQPVTHNAAAILNGGDTGEANGQLRIEGGAVWAGPVTLAGDIVTANDGLLGSTTGTGTVSGVVSDLGGAHPVAKVGGGTLVLSNPANTYAGPTWVRAGTLVVSSLKNAGTASSLGQPTGGDSPIKLGNGSTSARLAYTGTGDTTDRAIDMTGTSGIHYLEQAGSGLLTFSGDLTYSGGSSKTLHLHGATEGIGELAGTYANGEGGTNKLIKSGTGTWILSGENAYSGETEIQNGTLSLEHPNAIPANSLVRFSTTRNGVLEFANDGVGETELNITIGVGVDGTLATGVATGDTGINHNVGDLSLSQVTLTVARASHVVNGSPSITARSINLSGGNTYTTTLNPTTADLILGDGGILSGVFNKTLRLDGTSAGNKITGTLSNGLSTVILYKANTSTWTLSGSNTYSGATTVDNGTLVLSGADSTIAGSSSVALNSGATLLVSNTPALNKPDRLRDAAALNLNGGTFAYAHTGGAADYSETIGAVTLAAGSASTVSVSQADSGRTSALTFASLTRSANATLAFSGTGLGGSDRNRIFITAQPAGLIGFWASCNGVFPALYSSTLGVYDGALSDTEIAARGPTSVIPDTPEANARITTAGTSGPITLEGASQNSVALLQQATDTPAEVFMAGKTLRAHGLAINAGQASLTLGTAEGEGTLTALAGGGKLELANDASNMLTVNAAIADNTSASSLVKSGAGDVVIKGETLYTGPTTINAGSLAFGGHAFPQTVAGIVSGDGTLAKNGTNLLHLLAANTYTGPTLVNEGIVRVDQNSAFGTSAGGVFIADGATLDVGCSPDVGGTRNTNTLNLGSEVFTVSGTGVGGRGAIVNNSLVSQNAVFGKIALADDTSFGGTQRWDLRNNTPTLTMNGHTLTKVGPNTVGLTYANVIPGAGHIDIAQGILRLESSAKLNGDAANTLTVRSGAELELYKVSNPQGWSLILEDGASFDAANNSDNGSTTQNRWTGPVILNGAVTLTGDQPSSGTIFPYRADVQGEISGTGPLTKTGRSTIILSGTNTYTGQIRLTAGTLTVPRIGNVGEAGPLGQQSTSADAAIKFSGGTLAYTGPGETPDRTLELFSTGSATISHLGTGPLTFTNALAVTASGNKTLTLRGTAPDGEFSGAIANGSGSKISLGKADAGRWILSGNNSFTGDVTVSAGTLTLSGTNAQGPGAILIASAAANGILRLASGCQLTSLGTAQRAGGIMIGSNGGAHGAFYVTEGVVVNRTPGTGDDQAFTIGKNAGSYGYFHMSGGNMKITRIQTGLSSATSTSNTIGNVRMTGGTLTLPDYMLLARGKGSVSAFTVDGGTLNHTNASNNLSIGYEGGRGELNLTGGTLESYGRNLTVRQSANNSTGIVNLCAGLLSIDLFQNTAPGVALLNFAGGTLKAGNVNSTAFIPTSMTGVYSYGPFGVCAGGAVIDTATRTVTLAAPLQAPAGNGVYAIALSDLGSGYIGEPYVSIEGSDGVGATAVANMEDDGSGNGTYRVASVTVTSPGVNYVTPPTVLFQGGGRAAVSPTVVSVTLAPNASGGLTKLGDGILTLGGLNTYTGTTTVTAGTLKLGVAKALPTGTPVVLAGGTLDLSGFTVTNTLSGSGIITNGALQATLSPAGEGAVGADALTLKSASVKGTYLADVTASGTNDSVAVQGNIDLSNLALQIVDVNQLNISKTYTILTCTGTRAGAFSSTNLPDSRWHMVYLPDGTVRLIYVKGTLILVK
jgi:autotransporter-associated beta strand protein